MQRVAISVALVALGVLVGRLVPSAQDTRVPTARLVAASRLTLPGPLIWGARGPIWA